MNISYHWLHSIAPTIVESPTTLAERLGMLGAPVDELTQLATEIGDIVTARVTDVRSHPNADRLRICTVDAGGEELQVVCGASNVEAGTFYPFAPVGATLPGGVKIRKAKLRGEVSQGMLCSPRELGLGRDHAGLLALEGEWQPGGSFVEQLALDDARLVLDVTPNRPDLLSHVGVAGELAPGGREDVRLTPFAAEEVSVNVVQAAGEVEAGGVRVSIDDEGDCPRYMAAVVDGVQVGPSPDWLAMRLRAIGVRPINNIVDATNYVLHEVGQPLHAFDLEEIGGSEIRVRRAATGEVLRTLDGVDRTLDPEMIVIADAERPVALAGVMGGEASEVTESTTRILIECALFDPARVRSTARALGLSTDASHRFERGVDPELPPQALARVVDLILAVAGGEVRPGVADVTAGTPARHRVTVRLAAVRRLLGVDFSAAEIVATLTPIGFGAGQDEGGEAVIVEVPGFRPDVTREVDVIEEIARRHGYDRFDAPLSFFRPGRVPTDPLLERERAAHDLFARWGFHEARTIAFAPAVGRRVPLLNPLSAEESHLRDELIEGLVRRVEHNWAHGVRAVRLYEIGSVFRPDGAGGIAEQVRVAALLTGPRRPPHWSEETASWDVWDLKGLAAELAEIVGGDLAEDDGQPNLVHSLADSPRLRITGPGGSTVGMAGMVSGEVADAPAWADALWAVEVALNVRPPTGVEAYRELPAFPAVERDLALLVPEELAAGRVEDVLRSASGPLLERAWPFDLYAGEGLPEGVRSIAWRLRFRHAERTLTDAEVEESVTAALRALDEEFGVRRR